MNLDSARIPEGNDGLRIVREWAQDVCSDLGNNSSESKSHHRRWFMVACTLAFDLDWESNWDFVPHTPMYRRTLWPRSLSDQGVVFDAQDAVAFVTAEAYELLTFGSLFLRYVWGICESMCIPFDLSSQ